MSDKQASKPRRTAKAPSTKTAPRTPQLTAQGMASTALPLEPGERPGDQPLPADRVVVHAAGDARLYCTPCLRENRLRLAVALVAGNSNCLDHAAPERER